MMTRLLTIAALCLLASQNTVANESSERQAIELAAQAWISAFNRREMDALLKRVTDDVLVLEPLSAQINGRQALRAALSGRPGVRLSTNTQEVVISGDVAWRIAVISRADQQGTINAGQSLEIWKRVGGQWKLHRQMSSGLLTPAQSITRPSSKEPVLDKQVQ